MADGYRITVRGEMSRRFCQGFPGLVGHPASGRTVLEGTTEQLQADQDIRRFYLGVETKAH